MSWNGKNFDSKWVRTEFVLNGMSPPSPTKDLDLLLLARRQFRMTSNKLDWVASVMGVAGKVKHDGFQLWIDCMAGDEAAWKKMRTYNKRDVDILVEIYEKLLPWMGSDSPNMAIASGRPDACIVCAGENLSPRGRAYTTTGSYARYRCDDCFKWQKSKSSLATSNMRNI